MSFFLTRFLDVQAATNTEPGGILTLGGTNSSLFTGDIEFLNLAGTQSAQDATFWLLELTGTSVPSESLLTMLNVRFRCHRQRQDRPDTRRQRRAVRD